MKIKLNEIPEDGRDYVFNRQTAELNTILKDLIADAPFDAEIRIRPMNTKNYEIKGFIKSSTEEICSRCGENFKFKMNALINEILIPGAEEIKNSQFSKSNHVSELNEDGPGVSEYYNDQFDLGEFLHEAIALVIPFNPRHAENDPDCQVEFKLDSTSEALIYDEKMSEQKKTNAFEALKNLKLN